jgi:antitoxin component of RelBE/YafQ-DinJ toxin-antitoxin module
MKKVQISINPELFEDAKIYCKNNGCTFSGLVRLGLKKIMHNRKGDLNESN